MLALNVTLGLFHSVDSTCVLGAFCWDAVALMLCYCGKLIRFYNRHTVQYFQFHQTQHIRTSCDSLCETGTTELNIFMWIKRHTEVNLHQGFFVIDLSYSRNCFSPNVVQKLCCGNSCFLLPNMLRIAEESMYCFGTSIACICTNPQSQGKWKAACRSAERSNSHQHADTWKSSSKCSETYLLTYSYTVSPTDILELY